MAKRNGSVHVATTRRVYKGKVYTTYLLRRNYREGKMVKHETLGNISHLPLETIELIRRSLAGERFVSVDDAFEIERSIPHGHVAAILGSIRKLGLDAMISSKRCRERDLVIGMIAERLIHPCSKLATTRLWHATTLADELEVGDADEDDLYEAMDWLVKRQDLIEKKLSERHLKDGSLVLYDVSSSYYEGRHCELAQFGHNRDGKKGTLSIVYGVLTDSDGRPVAVEVYSGDTGDPSTLMDQVNKLKERFGLNRVVMVGDRGLLTQTQIVKLKENPGLGFITALRSHSIRQLMENGSLQMSLFDEKNLCEISSPDYPGERLVACYNPLMAEERRRKRLDLIEATERELLKIKREVERRRATPLNKVEIAKKVGKVINRRKVEKHFNLSIEDGAFNFERDEDAIRREAMLDGVYVIRTTEPPQRLSAEDVVRRYKDLARVERAFRCLKSIDILIRPIFHRDSERVRAHIFICMLAYYVEWHMRSALAPILFEDEELDGARQKRDPVLPAKPSASVKFKKTSHLTDDGLPVQSFKTLLAELATQCRNRCRIKTDPTASTFNQITTPTPIQKKTFELLGL
jgi:transposase